MSNNPINASVVLETWKTVGKQCESEMFLLHEKLKNWKHMQCRLLWWPILVETVNNTDLSLSLCHADALVDIATTYKWDELAKSSTDSTSDVCSWPWKFVVGKEDHPLSATRNRRIPVKNTLCWSAVVFCECEIIQLFSVVFGVVREVHK
jgi:hypothetical protein